MSSAPRWKPPALASGLRPRPDDRHRRSAARLRSRRRLMTALRLLLGLLSATDLDLRFGVVDLSVLTREVVGGGAELVAEVVRVFEQTSLTAEELQFEATHRGV